MLAHCVIVLLMSQFRVHLIFNGETIIPKLSAMNGPEDMIILTGKQQQL